MIGRLGGAWAPYRLALSSQAFRRLMAGYAVSALGDGAGYVAVAWLATQLAPPSERPVAVGLALGAYLLPGAVAGIAVGRWAHRIDPRHLVALDAGFRLTALIVIPPLYATGNLSLPTYVVLLAVSSLFHTFGTGGVVTLVSVHVMAANRFAANSFVEAVTQLSLTAIGPGIGGLLVAVLGAPAVILIDAATFLVLLVAAITLPRTHGSESPATEKPSGGMGFRALVSRPAIAWLLALTVVFYGLYGPVETAFPILVQHDLRQGPGLLGLIWAAFGVGALIGGLAAGTRTIHNLRRFALAIVAGWGLALLLVAATDNTVVIVLGIMIGGLVYAPYPAAATTLLQRELSGRELTSGAVAWNGIASGITPIGTLAGGPLVSGLGARSTLGASALATIGLAAAVTLLIRVRSTAG